MNYKLNIKEVGEEVVLVPTGEEKCPKCGALGKVHYNGINDDCVGSISLKCDCGYKGNLEEFIGEEDPYSYMTDFKSFVEKLNLNK